MQTTCLRNFQIPTVDPQDEKEPSPMVALKKTEIKLFTEEKIEEKQKIEVKLRPTERLKIVTTESTTTTTTQSPAWVQSLKLRKSKSPSPNIVTTETKKHVPSWLLNARNKNSTDIVTQSGKFEISCLFIRSDNHFYTN